MTNDEIHANAADVIDRIKNQYLAFPGIKAISLSNKHKGKKETGSYCIKFHVEVKKSINDLPIDQIIPNNIEGIPTDVDIHIGDPEKEFISPIATYRPMIPGNSICTASNPKSSGTLGCFVKITTASANLPNIGEKGYSKVFSTTTPNAIYLLTNAHVLRYAEDSTKVRQPRSDKSDTDCADVVALIESKKYDCAIAKIKYNTTDPDKLCYQNKVYYTQKDFSIISGFEDPTLNIDVYKIGAKTGYTEGKIIDINYTSASMDSGVKIRGWSDKGDSGSVWVRKSNNKAICLHNSGIVDSTYGVKYALGFPIKTQMEAFAAAGQWSIA